MHSHVHLFRPQLPSCVCLPGRLGPDTESEGGGQDLVPRGEGSSFELQPLPASLKGLSGVSGLLCSTA